MVLRARLDEYFSLSSDDHSKLESFSTVLLTPSGTPEGTAARLDPNNIGECLQFWLPLEQRHVIRDFMTRFLTLRPVEEKREAAEIEEEKNRDRDVVRAICVSLDVKRTASAERAASPDDAPPSAEDRLALGSRVSAALAPLFKE
jgi:hypothetical protein